MFDFKWMDHLHREKLQILTNNLYFIKHSEYRQYICVFTPNLSKRYCAMFLVGNMLHKQSIHNCFSFYILPCHNYIWHGWCFRPTESIAQCWSEVNKGHGNMGATNVKSVVCSNMKLLWDMISKITFCWGWSCKILVLSQFCGLKDWWFLPISLSKTSHARGRYVVWWLGWAPYVH